MGLQMGSYRQLKYEEREKLAELWQSKSSITQIAKALGRSKSTILREVRRNYSPYNVANHLEFIKIIPRRLLHAERSTPFCYPINHLHQCSWLMSYIDRPLVERSQKKHEKKETHNTGEL